MPDSFQVEMLVAAEPQRVFSAWLDPKEHAMFTGGGEAVVEPWNGGRFIAWDGYIHGILLGVDPPVRIVQTWRTSEFPPESRDSRVTVEFEPVRGGGTRVRVRHSDLPPSQVKRYEKGWLEHYLKPLARYFAKGGKQGAAKSPPPLALPTAWGRVEERKSRRGAAPAAKPGKAVAGRPAAKKSAAHKPVAHKPAAHRPAVHKPAARRPATHKSPARRPAPARKPVAKKSAARKKAPVQKKSAGRKSAKARR